MGHSDRCPDPVTYWAWKECVLCPLKPGHYVTTNCGRDDDGGHHESPFKRCQEGTFNDGSSPRCHPCSSCPPGLVIVKECTTTTDTICKESRNEPTTVPVSEPATSPKASPFFSSVSTETTTSTKGSPALSSVSPETTTSSRGSPVSSGVSPALTSTASSRLPAVPEASSQLPAVSEAPSVALWAVPLGIALCFLLVSFLAYIVKRKRGQYNSAYANPSFSSLSASSGNSDLEDVVGANVLRAPLHTVLDNLDVLEELVILLDPDSIGTKNTKHLASRCSFPSSWITYTYSMKESKSPLKAVLEGVTSRHPDWTVGHLAKHLQQIERNDAVAVLAKLHPNVMDV